ncbi:MAG: A/G-specific adenine glycosylase [Alphaproteobacteria bacterium]|nr:A/G-specific adenine glycosylase [Alphaproteobacteria bacterium]
MEKLEKPRILTPQRLRMLHQSLARWYAAHGRKDLPWRNTDDAYAIYLSEVMLQQTQVKTVLERFYFPFLTKFPTLKKLAAAPQDDVLRAWQGLGYYSRAINLHKAAKACKGKLPKTVGELVALPGIGRNTAHAICAFAYHAPVPVMEANLKRVLARIFAMEQLNEKELWAHAEDILDRKNPFDYNQAMMDIGATVCTKRSPKCSQCPAEKICAGKETPEKYPASRAKKTEKIRKKRIFILINDKKQIYATPRKTRFLGGLYHFIEMPDDAPTKGAKKLGDVRQVYSHFTLEAEVYLCHPELAEGSLRCLDSARHDKKNWHGGNALAALPFSAAEQKILALLNSYLSSLRKQGS